MKHILGLGVLSALVLSTSSAAMAAPTEGDMGFGPTTGGLTGQEQAVRGYSTGGGGVNSGYEGATTGQTTGNRSFQTTSDQVWEDNKESSQYTVKGQYRASSQGQSQTHQSQFKQVFNRGGNLGVQQGLQAPFSTSAMGFSNGLGYGFKGGMPSLNSFKYGYIPAVGTGSVNVNITSGNGKD